MDTVLHVALWKLVFYLTDLSLMSICSQRFGKNCITINYNYILIYSCQFLSNETTMTLRCDGACICFCIWIEIVF